MGALCFNYASCLLIRTSPQVPVMGVSGSLPLRHCTVTAQPLVVSLCVCSDVQKKMMVHSILEQSPLLVVLLCTPSMVHWDMWKACSWMISLFVDVPKEWLMSLQSGKQSGKQCQTCCKTVCVCLCVFRRMCMCAECWFVCLCTCLHVCLCARVFLIMSNRTPISLSALFQSALIMMYLPFNW